MSQQWWVFINGKQLGPATPQQMRQLVDQGKITPETPVIANGMQKPVAAGCVPGLFSQSPDMQAPNTAEQRKPPIVHKPPVVSPRPQSPPAITVAAAVVQSHSNSRPASDEQSFPLALKIACGGAALAILILALTMYLNGRSKQHAIAVTAATKSADEILLQSEAAFQAGNLDEADKLAAKAEAIKLSKSLGAVIVQRTRVASERRRLEAVAETAQIEAKKRAAEAEQLAREEKEAESRRDEERRLANIRALAAEKEAQHQAEVAKLDSHQQGFWLILENSLLELTKNVDTEVERFEIKARLVRSELDKERDPDVVRLRRLENRELVAEGKRKLPKVEREMRTAYETMMKSLTLAGSKPLPKYFEDRYFNIISKEVARIDATLSQLPQ